MAPAATEGRVSMYALAREGQQALIDAEPLVRRAREGDVAAFESLLEGRIAALLRLAVAITGDEIDARDAVQQACIHAWRELPRLRDADRFDPWLRRIVTNECRVSLRSRKRRRVREIAVSHLESDRAVEAAAAPTPGPSDRTEQLDLLERAFERLDPDARTLIALHHLEERSVAEIAAELALPVSTVKWRLHRARAALEQALELERR